MDGDPTLPEPILGGTPYPAPMMGWPKPVVAIDHSNDINRFFEVLNAHMIIAGARSFSIEELKRMPTGDLAKLIWPNGLNLVVKDKRFTHTQI
jgi:hypothetical protein